MTVLLVLLGITLYFVSGLLTVIAGLRNDLILKTDKGLIFMSICIWPIVWAAIGIAFAIWLLEPKVNEAINTFIEKLDKIAKLGTKKDENV